jgi:ClpP class serine protease
MSPEERRVLQALLDDVHGQFIGAVASGRKLEREEVVRFADGPVFSGTQAKDLKMVDALGCLEDAVLAAGKLAGLPSPPAVIQPKRKFSFMDSAAQPVRRGAGRRAAPTLASRVQDPPLFDGLRGPDAPAPPLRSNPSLRLTFFRGAC